MKSCLRVFHTTRPSAWLILLMFIGVILAACTFWSLGSKATNNLTIKTASASAQLGISVVPIANAGSGSEGASASDKIPAGLAANDWEGIKQAYERQRHAA